MMTELQRWLPYLAPPVLGAVIGYVTNYIAIRMLFRPLRPWRIFGLRLPLTPGIIPAKRDELARRMGEMVGTHLLTADDVRQALDQPHFQKELKTAVDDKLGSFLDRDLGSVASLVPTDYRARFRELVDLLCWKVVRQITDYLASDEFERGLRDFLQREGDKFLARDIESYLTPERYQQLRHHLDDRLTTLLHDPQTLSAVARMIDERVERLLTSERSLRELLPADFIELLLKQIEQELPPLLERFGGLLYDPEFRQRLVVKAREGIKNFLDSLSGLTGLLSGFINVDQLYARIPDFLDRTGEEVARWLREEKTQQQVAALVRERLEHLLDRPVGSFLEKMPYDKVSAMRRFVRERVVGAVQSRRSVELLLYVSEQGLHKIKDRSFASLADQLLPEGGLERLRAELADRLLVTLRSGEAERALDRVIRQHIEVWLFERPVGCLAARLPADVRAELEDGLYRQLGELLQREVPPLIDTLDVARMVENKVNQLDILKVEGLLMGIMKEQFKYINLFGALLGFLIGLLNLAVWQLMLMR